MSCSLGASPGAPARALAPDLARGLMLLLIAVANVPWYLWATQPSASPWWDRAVRVVTVTAIEARVFPLFAFLLGYGMVQFTAARRARGLDERQADRMLRRRHLGLLVVGAVHGTFLFVGDIVGAYGLAGLVLVAVLWRRRDRAVLGWVAGLVGVFAVVTLVWVVSVVPIDAGRPDVVGPKPLAGGGDYLAGLPDRFAQWLLFLPVQGLLLTVVPACILLGWVAARHRVLEDPGGHLSLLRRTAVAGLAVAWSAGLVHGLAAEGVLPASGGVLAALALPQYLTGMAGGLGYAALFALLAHRLRARRATRGPLERAVVAVGRRSLTCYLLQSVFFVLLLSTWGLGLGGQLGSAAAAALAVGVWCLTVVVALLLQRVGRRGPAEAFLARVQGQPPPAAPSPAAPGRASNGPEGI